MESIYLAERTWRKPYHLLSPSFIASRPKSRPVVPHVNTALASTRVNCPQQPQPHFDDSPEVASPNSPDDTFTSYPSPTTAATTPATSPLYKTEAKHRPEPKETTHQVGQPRPGELGADAKMMMRNLEGYVEMWIKRYMEEMIRNREMEERFYGKGDGVAVGEHF